MVLAKPRVFMNESGRQVGPLAKFFSVAAADVITIHDELDIDFGRIRLKLGGGEGGHNGLRSVASSLGTKDFQRVRVGIGRPSHPSESASYVLGRFPRADDRALQDALELASDAALAVAEQGAVKAMNEFNRRKPG